MGHRISPPPVTDTGREGKVVGASNSQNMKQHPAETLEDSRQGSAQPVISEPAEQPRSAKRRWSHRRIALLSTPLLITAIVGAVMWLGADRSGKVRCPNPPTTATLNFWPVTYSAPAEACHDYPAIDARIANEEGNYSRSREEWERGLTARSGDEIYISMYVNNGAADAAEELNPGHGIARNVRVTTEVDQNIGAEHYVRVKLEGDNTNTVVNRFKITTAPNERLEVIPKSGQIRNNKADVLIAKDLDVGNSTITIKDLLPKWESSVFVRFTVKVVT